MASAYGAYHSRPPFGRAGTKTATAPPRAAGASLSQIATPGTFEAAQFRVAAVLRRALGVLGPNAVTLVALIALAAIPERAFYHLVGVETKLTASTERLVLMTSGFMLQLAVIRLALDSFAGDRARFGACVGQVFRSFFPVLAIALIAAIPLMVLSLLLVVPGVILSLSWAAVLPAQIAEGLSPLSCFKRSAELTRGHHWKILFVFLIIGLALAPLLLILQAAWGMPLSAHAVFFDQNWLARLLFNAAVAIGLAAAYHELRAAQGAGSRIA